MQNETNAQYEAEIGISNTIKSSRSPQEIKPHTRTIIQAHKIMDSERKHAKRNSIFNTYADQRRRGSLLEIDQDYD